MYRLCLNQMIIAVYRFVQPQVKKFYIFHCFPKKPSLRPQWLIKRVDIAVTESYCAFYDSALPQQLQSSSFSRMVKGSMTLVCQIRLVCPMLK